MKKIVLLMESNKKKTYPTTAGKMYEESHTFRLTYQYAQMIADEVYVLSPRYGVVHIDQIIGGEEEQVERWSKAQWDKWGRWILSQLDTKVDLQGDRFEILAEEKYYKPIINRLKYYKLPLQNKEQKEWIPYIQKLIYEEKCRFKQLEKGLWDANSIHKVVQCLPSYNYLTIKHIPFDNGVYFMIDKNEEIYGCSRIVRVGTHRGEGRLKKRLEQHFMTEDKNGSTLRRYIGSALLSKDKDNYFKVWDCNLRNQEIYQESVNKVKINKEREIENKVSRYLRESMRLYCIDLSSYEERLRFKEEVIKVLYKDKTFKATDDWLGNYNNMLHIGTYGLWNNEIKIKEFR